jgi:hypothetical protein
MAMAAEVFGRRRSGRLTVAARLAILIGRRPCPRKHRASARAVTFESAGDRGEPGRKGLWCHRRLAARAGIRNTAHALGTEADIGDPAKPDECSRRRRGHGRSDRDGASSRRRS